MSSKTVNAEPSGNSDGEPIEMQDASPDFALDVSDFEQETNGSGKYECGQVLHLFMSQLEQAVPLAPEEELALWRKLAELHLLLRRELAFCGDTYNYAVRLLEKLDTPESLNDIFSPSLLTEFGRAKMLDQSRKLLQRYSEIYGHLRSAFASGDTALLEKERRDGAELMAAFPFQNELILELAEQLRMHRLVMEGSGQACRTLLETVFFCSRQDFFSWIARIESLLHELSETQNRLVYGYLRMVFSIAKKFKGHGVPLADLIQEGNIGLMKAINKFDWNLGHRFSTYAVWWIKQCVCHAVGRQSRVIRLPMHMLTALNKINKAEQQFLQENGREGTSDEIAARLNITRERVSSLKRMAMQSISLQAPVYSGSGRDILLEDTIENIHDSDSNPMRELSKKILSDKLSQILSSLPPRTRQVLTLRYGLNGAKPMSLNAMSQHFRISRERIRQIEINALEKMRNPETISLLEDYFS